MTDCKAYFKATHTCVIVPTYNNQGTLIQVLERLQPFADDILVVNDGSTDNTQQLLENYQHPITLVSYPQNQGKGYALRQGFQKALSLGFENAITIDSDGQHYPEDLPLFADAMQKHPGALIVGNRKLVQENMAGKSTFANYFSNFWFMVQTWQYLPDTQTGYRVYPLRKLRGTRFLTSRYEAELELLVFQAWHGVKLVSTPIRVYYPPKEERVSHFRPFHDFMRISLLNTVLCILCLCYGWWSMVWHSSPVRSLRVRLLTIWDLTFALVSAMLVPLPLVFIFKWFLPKTDRQKLKYHKILCAYFRFLLHHIPGVKVTLDNPYREQFAKPSILFCNHQSHLDLLSVLSLSPRVVAMTNQWVWDFWIYKPVLRYLEYYPATEGLENSEGHIESLLKRGYSIVIFPEGTRSAACKILKFRRGAFYLAETLKADMVPVFLDGTGRVFPKKETMIYPGEIRIHVGKRFSADDTSTGENYREKTRYWHKYYENIDFEKPF
ncbi:MAG: glycosyltransferase [Bacteroidales bacterium]|nr:glycosyltransferase [Bacteroidales bacterium]